MKNNAEDFQYNAIKMGNITKEMQINANGMQNNAEEYHTQ